MKTSLTLSSLALMLITQAFHLNASAQEISIDPRALVDALRAYGQCIDARNAITPIRSDAALESGNAQCAQHLARIRQISPAIAQDLQQHMRQRVQALANNTPSTGQ